MNVKRGYVPIEIGGKELYCGWISTHLQLADQRLGGSALQASVLVRFTPSSKSC